jgi:nicotinamidase-related amidase
MSESRLTAGSEVQTEVQLDATTSALVLIDLQKGIVSRDTKPHAAVDVVARCSELAARFRTAGSVVVLVHVAFSADDGDRLKPPADGAPPVTLPIPAEFSELVPELNRAADDIVITKHQWGAFYGTELDLQLRRRGIRTIVIAGIATNFGVESTARDGWERGYEIVFVEDAMASFSEEWHRFAVTAIFPRIGRVRSSVDVAVRS